MASISGLLLTSTLAEEIIDGGAEETVIGGGGGTQPDPWNVGDLLVVGENGTGSLTISGGGVVNSGVGNTIGSIARLAGSQGTITVTGVGSALFDTGRLRVGEKGSGLLTISNGGQVDYTAGISQGGSNGAEGTIHITGLNSTLSHGNHLTVGVSGVANLIVSDGGNLTSSGGGDIGSFASGNGAALITGNGSLWDMSTTLAVGRLGTGSLTIEDGGHVDNGTGIIGEELGSQGAVAVTGAGSEWVNNLNLVVGDEGTGSLVVSDGASVSSIDGRVGYNGSEGMVTVTGVGSNWTNSGDLVIGRGENGSGAIIISDGGEVRNDNGFVASQDGEGFVTVTGVGSTWNNSGVLSVGFLGVGELTISNGGVVTNTLGSIGSADGLGDGRVTVTDVGSTWTNSDNLIVGGGGEGELIITDGGVVNNVIGFIGGDSGSQGTAAVVGAGSVWNNSSFLAVGNEGAGTLLIIDGGVVNNTNAALGAVAGSTGFAMVRGAGSVWNSTGDFGVGDDGAGVLTISNGGTVLSSMGVVAFDGTGVGNVTVTGIGSNWSNSNSLFVGGGGFGTLTINEGAGVYVDSGMGIVNIAHDVGSTGVLNIGSEVGQTAVAAGVLGVGEVVFGNGSGTLVLNHTDTDYIFSPDTSGNGVIEVYSGMTNLTGNAAHTGGTTIFGGSLFVNGSAGEIMIEEGVLGGEGTTGSVVAGGGGMISPGNSIGTLSVNGDVEFFASSAYEVEIDGLGNSDLLDVSGVTTISPNASISMTTENGDFLIGVDYTVIDSAGGVVGEFETVADNFAFIDVVVDYTPTEVLLNLMSNGLVFEDIAITPNQIATAGGLDSLGAGNTLYDGVLLLSEEDALRTFDALSGEVHASVKSSFIEDSQFLRSAVTDRLRNSFGSVAAPETARVIPSEG